jgi:hypothetical protein
MMSEELISEPNLIDSESEKKKLYDVYLNGLTN